MKLLYQVSKAGLPWILILFASQQAEGGPFNPNQANQEGFFNSSNVSYPTLGSMAEKVSLEFVQEQINTALDASEFIIRATTGTGVGLAALYSFWKSYKNLLKYQKFNDIYKSAYKTTVKVIPYLFDKYYTVGSLPGNVYSYKITTTRYGEIIDDIVKKSRLSPGYSKMRTFLTKSITWAAAGAIFTGLSIFLLSSDAGDTGDADATTMEDSYLSKEGFQELLELPIEDRAVIFEKYPQFAEITINTGLQLAEEIAWNSMSQEKRQEAMKKVSDETETRSMSRTL